jgi:AcrR family transcriptional regulator
MAKLPAKGAAVGLRERKRRQTRERLIETALGLFLKRGFDAVTVDDIAAAADTTKRTFFDYFPSKEDVIAAWQDDFGATLAAGVRARPTEEPWVMVVERAFIEAISSAATPQSIAVSRLVESTPALQARNQVKYARLEQTLADALLERAKDERSRFRARLLSLIIIGALRISAEDAVASTRSNNRKIVTYTGKMFRTLWAQLRELVRISNESAR